MGMAKRGSNKAFFAIEQIGGRRIWRKLRIMWSYGGDTAGRWRDREIVES